MSENENIVSTFDEKHDESLDIRLERIVDIDRCLILRLSGYVDTYNTALFQRRVNLAIEAGYVKLIFDCIRLNYFSSTGIGSFTAFLKTVKPEGGDIVMFGIQPKLMEIFQLLGFSQFLSIKNSQDEALAHFRIASEASPTQMFPKIIRCPKCAKRLRAVKAGRFRCTQCSGILAIDSQVNVILE